ncbi:MAG: hypothetical protein RIG77_20280 [Cyclobacteriaceae bacterium]
MTKWHKLFEVRFFHEFYGNYSSRDIEVFLSAETKEILTSYQLNYKKTSEGFIILYKDDRKYLLEQLKGGISLFFGLRSTNRHFTNFSNYEPKSGLEKYFFSNRSGFSDISDPNSPNYEPIKLHTGSYFNENNLCLSCQSNSNLKEVLIDSEIVINKGNEIYFEGELDGRERVFDILGSSYGAYDVALKNSGNSEVLCYSPDFFSKAFGLIEIDLGSTEATKFEAVKGSEYHIRFENRSVIWNYFFVSKKKRVFESIELFSGKQKLEFSDPLQVTLINGQEATKVASLGPLPLRKAYSWQQLYAELKEDELESSHEFVKKKIYLPTPDITRIKGTIVEGSESYFSDMYIYL